MKLNPWYLAGVVPVAAIVGTSSPYAAQLLVLGLTFGIFFGTLSLGRPAAEATTTNPGHG